MSAGVVTSCVAPHASGSGQGQVDALFIADLGEESEVTSDASFDMVLMGYGHTLGAQAPAADF